MEKLIIEGNEGGPLEFELEGDVVTLGRHEENRITIENRYLSQFHAKFSRVAGKEGREILDLDSYNGTKVNGEDIQLRILRFGDMITLGRSVLLFGSRDEIAGHFVHVDDGRFATRDRYWSTPEDTANTADLVGQSDEYQHLLVYGHGGLNSPAGER